MERGVAWCWSCGCHGVVAGSAMLCVSSGLLRSPVGDRERTLAMTAIVRREADCYMVDLCERSCLTLNYLLHEFLRQRTATADATLLEYMSSRHLGR